MTEDTRESRKRCGAQHPTQSYAICGRWKGHKGEHREMGELTGWTSSASEAGVEAPALSQQIVDAMNAERWKDATFLLIAKVDEFYREPIAAGAGGAATPREHCPACKSPLYFDCADGHFKYAKPQSPAGAGEATPRREPWQVVTDESELSATGYISTRELSDAGFVHACVRRAVEAFERVNSRRAEVVLVQALAKLPPPVEPIDLGVVAGETVPRWARYATRGGEAEQFQRLLTEQKGGEAERLAAAAKKRVADHEAYCEHNKPSCDCKDIALIRDMNRSILQSAREIRRLGKVVAEKDAEIALVRAVPYVGATGTGPTREQQLEAALGRVQAALETWQAEERDHPAPSAWLGHCISELRAALRGGGAPQEPQEP